MDPEAMFEFMVISNFCSALLGGAACFLACVFCFGPAFRLSQAIHTHRARFKELGIDL